MSEKVSKAQLEVWEVKERLSKEVINLGLKEGMHALLEKAARVANDLKKRNKLKPHLTR